MKTTFNHVQFNIDMVNIGFYRDLFGFLGWQTLYEGEDILGVGDGNASLWFVEATNDVRNDHDSPGLNHIGITTETQEAVDETVAYLRQRGVELLYGTPCHRPEYAGEEGIYYSSMFDSPDNILIEVVYTGSTPA